MKKITILLLWISLSSYAQVFTDVTGSMEQLSYAFSTWADFDGDGDLDLYYTGQLDANGNGGGLYINHDGVFTLEPNSNLPLLNTGAADSGDFNGDGYPDIVVMGADMPSYNGNADIYINNADGTFTALNTGLNGSFMGDVKFFDSDNDGDLDVLLTGFDNSYAYFTTLYVNDNGSLSELTTLSLPNLNFGKISISDYDADGDNDFTLSGLDDSANSTYTKVWKNEGNNVFSEQNLGLPQLWLGGMVWADMDEDGDLDLLLSGTSYADSEIHLMLNDNGTFTQDPNFDITPAHKGDIEVGDFNLDGHLDIFVVGNYYKYVNSNDVTDEKIAKIFIYDPAVNTYVEDNHNNFTGAEYAVSQAIDYDGDNKTDIFYTGMIPGASTSYPYTRLYHNDTIAGMEEEVAGHFDIFPNPVYDVLHVNPQTTGLYQVEIMDITGKTVYQQEVSTALDIDFSSYNRGVYLLKVTENNKSFVQKLIHK